MNREELQELFRDFFIFHNDANLNTCAVDEYFNKWYDARFNSNEPKMVACSSCEHCRNILPSFDEPFGSIYCAKKHWDGSDGSDLDDLIICEDFELMGKKWYESELLKYKYPHNLQPMPCNCNPMTLMNGICTKCGRTPLPF